MNKILSLEHALKDIDENLTIHKVYKYSREGEEVFKVDTTLDNEESSFLLPYDVSEEILKKEAPELIKGMIENIRHIKIHGTPEPWKGAVATENGWEYPKTKLTE